MTAKILTLFAALATSGTLVAIVELWRQHAGRIAVRVTRYSRSTLPERAE